MNLTDLLVNKREREADFFERPQVWARRIRDELRESLPACEVYLFGSTVSPESEPTASSDIDLLVHSSKMPDRQSERARLAASLTDLLGSVHPFELHFVDDRGLAWYRRFAELERIGE